MGVAAAPTARPLSAPAYVAFAVACIGGPLALVSLAVITASGDAAPSVGLSTALGSLLFAAPLLVWLRFSERIVSAGGLYAFVEAAAGRRVARVHGGLWIASYFLYLPFTVVALAQDALPGVWPGLAPYRTWLQVLLPLAFIICAFIRLDLVVVGLGIAAAVQLVLVGVIAALGLHHLGAPASSFGVHANGRAIVDASSAFGLLYVCLSLPLYLGAEVRGGARTVRLGLIVAFAVVAAAMVAGAFAFASAPAAIVDAETPAAALASAASGHTTATVVGAITVVSIAGLIVAELLALGRLLPAMLGAARTRALVVVSILFVAVDALALMDTDRVYDDALKISLAALYASQIVVFAVYPRFRARTAGRASPVDLVATGVACALFGYGLYVLATGSATS